MEDNYYAVLMQLLVVTGFAVSTLLLSVVFGKAGKRTEIKDSAYECGMLPIGGPAARFSVKFYLVAMLFVLFDLEVVFLYPWGVVFKDFLAVHGHGIFWTMAGFVGLLGVAYVYALKKGALKFSA
jgi:NADH-quinone oxidoreductase subunit A